MAAEQLLFVRGKLRTRLARLQSVRHGVLHFALMQFWGFLQGEALLRGIIDDLSHRFPTGSDAAREIVQGGKTMFFGREDIQVAVSASILEECASSQDDSIEVKIGGRHSAGGGHEAQAQHFVSLFVEPLCCYLEEHLDDARSLLAVLRRFKHKCEWFRRDELYALWAGDRRRGEKLLNMRLYEYLHDQGIDFSIEPSSASGEADLVSAQVGEERLVVESKVFSDPSQDRNRVRRGFGQLYYYTVDYNEPFGYLVIFKTCPEGLALALSGSSQGTPYMLHNNKTIFFVTIDIHPYEGTASERGTLRSAELSEEDMVRGLTEAPEAETSADDD